MRKYIIIASFSLLALLFLNCEKDDICESGTPTTPRLIVEFFDNTNPTNAKNIKDLALVAEGTTDTLNFNAISKIEIPLQTNSDITKYNFISDSNNASLPLRNEDKIEINYIRKDQYISRACGFKTLYTLNQPNGMIQIIDTNPWIQEISIQNIAILNENEVHVKIFH